MSASRTAPRMLIRQSRLCARARATEMRILLYRSHRRRRRRGGDCAATVVRRRRRHHSQVRKHHLRDAKSSCNSPLSPFSARHATTQGCNKSLGRGHSRLEMRPTLRKSSVPSLDPVRLRTLSFVEWGTFSCLGRNAVMPLCSLCDCPFLSPLPSTRPPRVGFGSRDAQIGLYCTGFITAAIVLMTWSRGHFSEHCH